LREPKKPRQASLRRAISAAYYALFHLLIDEAAKVLTRSKPATLRAQVRRAFAHVEMKDVCKSLIRKDSKIVKVLPMPIEAELASVASAFVDLQEARHKADYDFSIPVNRVEALQKVSTVKKAFADWAVIRKSPNAAAFLTALLLQKRWAKG
jgi:hypothetical protein